MVKTGSIKISEDRVTFELSTEEYFTITKCLILTGMSRHKEVGDQANQLYQKLTQTVAF
jgi:hypothetical protein